MALFLVLALWLLMAPAPGAGGGAGPGAHGGSAGGAGGGSGAAIGSGRDRDRGMAEIAGDGTEESGAGPAHDAAAALADATDASRASRSPLRVGFTQVEEAPLRPAPEPAEVPKTSAPAGGSAGRAGGGGGGSGAATFMGVEGRGKRIAFVIDRSGSMASGNRFAHARYELKRSIRALSADHFFFVFFFNEGSLPMPASTLVSATTANKERYSRWIDQQQIMGGTDPTEAMLHALSLQPETIFLMSDGIFDIAAADRIRAANRHGCVINTIAFHDPSGEVVLQRIARENGGTYRFVPPPGGSP